MKFSDNKKSASFIFSLLFSSLSAYGTYLLFNIKLHEPPKPPTFIEIVELPEEKQEIKKSEQPKKQIIKEVKKETHKPKQIIEHKEPIEKQKTEVKQEVKTEDKPVEPIKEESKHDFKKQEIVEKPPEIKKPQPPPSSPPKHEEPPSPPPPPPKEPDKSVLNQYYATVRKIIESKKRYPEEAKRKEEEGAVLVKFTIDEDGNVKDVALVRSSDSRILDKETLRLLNSLKFPPPPEGKPMTLNLEIEYKLN
jgi:protein TonB